MERAPAAWVVRPFPDGIDSYSDFCDREYVAVGWPDVDHFLNLSSENAWSEVKTRVIAAYGPQKSSHALGQWVGVIHRFIVEMQPGDLVLVPYYGVVSFGRIISEYHPERENGQEHAVHRRKVRWLYKSVARFSLNEEITISLKGRQTVYRASLDEKFIIDVLNGLLSFRAEDTSAQAITMLARAILETTAAGRQQGINQLTFEKSVLPQILRAGFGVVTTSTQNTPGDGDYDLRLNVLPDLAVFVQVKYKYQGKIAATELEWAKHQVREAIRYHKTEQEEILGVVVMVGTLDDGLAGGWHYDEGKEKVLVVMLSEMMDWIASWVETMSAKELLGTFPALALKS